MSYQLLDHEFDDENYLVQGINLTDANQESNGSGKTGFQTIITFAIFGAVHKKTSISDYIRHGEDQAITKISLYCDVRQEKIDIERIINLNTASKVVIYINGGLIGISTVSHGNDFIQKWIDIGKENFVNYVIVNRDRGINFLAQNNSDRVRLISELSNADLLDNVIDTIKSNMKSKESVINASRLEMANLEGQITSLQDQLQNNNDEQWQRNKQNRIRAVNDEIEAIEKRITYRKTQISENEQGKKNEKYNQQLIRVQIVQLSQKLEKIDLSPIHEKIETTEGIIQRVNEELKDVEIEKDKCRTHESSYQNKLSQVLKNLMNAITCPRCSYQFLPGQTVNIKDEKKLKEVVEKKIEEIKSQLVAIESSWNAKQNQLKAFYADVNLFKQKESELLQAISKLKLEISSYENDLTLSSKTLENLQNEIDDHQQALVRYACEIVDNKEKIVKIESEKQDTSKNQLVTDKIVKLQGDKDDLQGKINESENDVNDMHAWSQRFKGFKAFLSQKFLATIEAKTNYYLLKIKSDIQIKWLGYKLKKDGSFSEEITANCIRNGISRPFASYSGGEKARMEFCTLLAMHDIINETHQYGGIDFLFIDERFEGLDTVGLNGMLQAISDLNYPLLITTHVSDQDLYANVLTIIKEDGKSRLHKGIYRPG